MKRFSFSLERVLEFRRQLEELERGRLQSLEARRVSLLQRAGEMAAEARLCRLRPASQAAISALDLRSAYDYAQALGRAREETLGEAARVAQQRQAQMVTVIQARRGVKLLEILRSKQLRRHMRLADREMEAVASELHLAKLGREGRPVPSPAPAAGLPARPQPPAALTKKF
ncbi:MAG TPA: hypothetical protein VEU62_02980 [Bryobacterales bacterium]|nr:hypothetical protein [Bryobacterales bacterium]